MSIHVIFTGKYNESIYKRLDCEITLYVYKNKCGWVAPNNGSRWAAFREVNAVSGGDSFVIYAYFDIIYVYKR